MTVKGFPPNLVSYELALEESLRVLIKGTMINIPKVEHRDVEDAYFQRKAPEDFAASCLESLKWLSQEELKGEKSESEKIEDTLTGELF